MRRHQAGKTVKGVISTENDLSIPLSQIMQSHGASFVSL